MQHSDRRTLEALYRQVTDAVVVELQDSPLEYYFRSLGSRLFDRLGGTTVWTRAFTRDGEVIGILGAEGSPHGSKGDVARPLVPDEHLDDLPAMLEEVAAFMRTQGMASMRIAVPSQRRALIDLLDRHGWTRTATLLGLVKRLG